MAVQKVAIVECLQAKQLKIVVPLNLQRAGNPRKIEVCEFFVEHIEFDSAPDELGEYSHSPVAVPLQRALCRGNKNANASSRKMFNNSRALT